MKGIILAGGTGSRLYPLTKITNKHLLPIYDKPMIYYPIMKLREIGVREVLIVSGRDHAGRFLELLGSGSEFGMNFAYEVQDEAGGIAQALGLAETFIEKEKFVTILGDNIYEDDSGRGELEISDVNDHYVKSGGMGYSILEGFWGDCGESIDGMMDVARTIQKKARLSEREQASLAPKAPAPALKNLDFA
jgi:dTDP-glucose pyrophosphorylase